MTTIHATARTLDTRRVARRRPALAELCWLGRAGHRGAGTVVALAALAVTAAVVVAAAHFGIGAGTHAIVAALAAFPAAMALSLHARVVGDRGTAWLAGGVAALATACLVGAVTVSVAGPAGTDSPSAAGPVLAVLAAVGLRAARDLDAPRRPVRSGVVLGAGTALVLGLAGWVLPGPDASPTVGWGLALVTVVAALVAAVQLLDVVLGEPQVVALIATGGVAVAVADAGGHGVVTASDTTTVVLRTLGVALLGAGAAWMLRASVTEATGQLGRLRRDLDDLEAAARGDRHRLHELRSTLAGITSASQVARTGTAASQRQRLEEMIDLELQRAQRLLDPEPRHRPAEAAVLDDALRPVLLSHRSRDRDVSWSAGAERLLQVRAAADDQAEIVNVLIENAFRHGSGPVRLDTRLVEPGVAALTVTDRGRGPAPEVRERLFGWGARSATSPGQGIGLHGARALAERNGGTLDLLDGAAEDGCTFELRLAVAAGAS